MPRDDPTHGGGLAPQDHDVVHRAPLGAEPPRGPGRLALARVVDDQRLVVPAVHAALDGALAALAAARLAGLLAPASFAQLNLVLALDVLLHAHGQLCVAPRLQRRSGGKPRRELVGPEGLALELGPEGLR